MIVIQNGFDAQEMNQARSFFAAFRSPRDSYLGQMDSPSGHSKHILLADDDDDDRLLFKEALREIALPPIVTEAHDGEHLLNLLSSMHQLPDVLFLDLNMPFKNGIECLEEIRAHTLWNGVPVIIFSTSSHPGTIDRAFELGAQLYIRKPNDFKSLKRVIQHTLSLDWTNGHRPSRENFVLEI